jgi:hypothetical protein
MAVTSRRALSPAGQRTDTPIPDLRQRPAHIHHSAGSCLLSVGYVHMLHDRSLACTQCSWTYVQSRYFEGGLDAAAEHDSTHRAHTDLGPECARKGR